MLEERWLNCIKECTRYGASDIFFQADCPVYAKFNGQLSMVTKGPVSKEEMEKFIKDLYSSPEVSSESRDMTKYNTRGDDDFSFVIPDVARFRVNAFHQRNAPGAVLRVVPFGIPDYKMLNIPETVINLVNYNSGLIIVCGQAGSGKSTTQACMIDAVNQTRAAHIVTIEDPIEYFHTNIKSLITQREVPGDAKDFDSALTAALRQAPDIILVGEMRDYATIRTAVTAAETGHLVIATLHTQDSISTIDRIIDIFPAEQQSQIRSQLATTLRAVVAQRMVSCTDGKARPAFEILISNLAVATYIREKQTHQIVSILAGNKNTDSVSMDDALWQMYCDKVITKEVLLQNCTNPDTINTKLSNQSSGSQMRRPRF